MLNRKTSVILFFCVAFCACVYQETEAKEDTSKHVGTNPFLPLMNKFHQIKKKVDAKQSFLFNPLKLVLRILALITYPPRFLLRFVFTFVATFILTLFGCQIIPEVDCGVPLATLIPGIMDNLKQELDFYVNLAPSG